MDTEPPNTSSDAHLKALFEGDPTIRFTTIKNLEAAARQLYAQHHDTYLICTGVPPDKFQRLGTDRSSALYHAPLLYIPPARALRIKLPASAAGTAVCGFGDLLHDKLVDVGARRKISGRGTSLVRMEDVSKQPDGSWGPVQKTYVTCVLEVGVSETEQKLALSARLWLEKLDCEDGRIRQVVTINLAPETTHIVLRKWERPPRLLRDSRAQMAEEVHVSLDNNNVPMATGSLTLSFAKLLERPPAPGTREVEDIVLSAEDLTELALSVWRQQGLISEQMVLDYLEE